MSIRLSQTPFGSTADRLPGVVPDEIPGGHMSMLSHPAEIATYLDTLVAP